MGVSSVHNHIVCRSFGKQMTDTPAIIAAGEACAAQVDKMPRTQLIRGVNGMKVLEVGRIEWQDQSVNGAIISGTPEQLRAVAAIMLNDRGGSIVVSDAADPIRAAAPDMLKALKAVLRFVENTESEMGIILGSGDMVRAAIAKAQGAGE